MILLGIFDALLWIFEGVFSLVLGPLPDQITSILAYIFTLLDDGFNFVYQVLIDADVARLIAGWMLSSIVVLFGLDIAMKVLHAIKLESKHEENG